MALATGINELRYTVSDDEKQIDYNLFAGIQSVIRINDIITGNDGQKYRITAKTRGKLLAVIIWEGGQHEKISRRN